MSSRSHFAQNGDGKDTVATAGEIGESQGTLRQSERKIVLVARCLGVAT